MEHSGHKKVWGGNIIHKHHSFLKEFSDLTDLPGGGGGGVGIILDMIFLTTFLN